LTPRDGPVTEVAPRRSGAVLHHVGVNTGGSLAEDLEKAKALAGEIARAL
jgi:hypothetical protein